MDKKDFTNKDLAILFIPLIIEQFLEYLVGLFDSIMVSHIGEAAVSGVSLVEFVIQLVLSFLIALATGGAVKAGQYLGQKRELLANKTANQLIWFTGFIGIFIMLVMYILKSIIFTGLFGKIDIDVYNNANIYYMIVTASIPFLALYNSEAAIFRTMGNSKLPMLVMLFMNILNVIGNYILIYILEWGTAGAAIPTFISRLGSAVIVLSYLTDKNHILNLKKSLKYHINKKIIKEILSIGIPFGLENGMFYFGRLVIVSLVATFGTAAIAANSVSQTIALFEVLPGTAIGLGLTVIISRYVGMKEFDKVRYYTKKVIGIIYILFFIMSAIVLFILPKILEIYGLSDQATQWIYQLVWVHAIMLLIWPLAYSLPVVFRAAGDAKFPMIISTSAMIFCRIILSFVFALYFNMGMVGTWVAMFLEWIVKGIIFTYIYLGRNWLKNLK